MIFHDAIDSFVSGKTLAEWRRTAFPGRREVSTPHDGQGRPSYEASQPFG